MTDATALFRVVKIKTNSAKVQQDLITPSDWSSLLIKEK